MIPSNTVAVVFEEFIFGGNGTVNVTAHVSDVCCTHALPLQYVHLSENITTVENRPALRAVSKRRVE